MNGHPLLLHTVELVESNKSPSLQSVDIAANFTGLKSDLKSGIDFYKTKLKDLTCVESVDMENSIKN